MFVTVDKKRELQAIATATGKILAKVQVPIGISGTPPLELAISPDGSQVYVFAPQDVPYSLLLAVNTATYQVTATQSLPFNNSVGPLLVSPDGTQLYFEVGLVNQYIQVIDAATLSPLTTIPVNVSLLNLGVTPSGLILMTDTNNELLVINPKKAAIVNRFSLSSAGQILSGAVVSSPDSATAYIGFGGPSILAVSIQTGALVFNAPIPYNPSQFVISPDGSKLYSLDHSNKTTPAISEFSIQTQKPVTTVQPLGPATSFALSHDGNTLYVLNGDTSAIVPVSVPTHNPVKATLAGVGVNSLAIPPNGTTVWASSYEFTAGGEILMLNPATGQLNFMFGPSGALSFSPSGSVVYVASPSELNVLDAQSMKQIGEFPAGQLENIGQAIPSPDGKSLYVSITFVSGSPTGANTVLPPGVIVVVDSSTKVKTINVPGGLGVFALTPDGSTLVCTSNRGQVHIISTATGAVTGTIILTPSNGALQGIALSKDASTAYVIDAVNNLLFLVSLTNHSQQNAISVGKNPLAVAITPDGSEAWVATSAGLEIVNLLTAQVSAPVPLPGTPSAIVFN